MNERILLMDDDKAYISSFCKYLVAHGYQVSTARDGRDVELRLQRDAPHLVLLEQRLGDMTGTTVLRRIRAVSPVPVIILTRKSDQIERIINLEIGADDEVHKSVTRRETLARMRAVLRRSHVRLEPQRQGWTLLEAQRDVLRPDGLPCALTTAEFGVLRLLMAARGEPVSRMELSRHVFGRALTNGDRAVDTVIYKLRSKLGAMVIVTVRPIGYAFAGFADGQTQG
jgi:DNA-binding response OmpR family regulator